MILDFGDGGAQRKAPPLDQANADLLRMLTTWRMWRIKACIAANSLKATFLALRRVVAHCSENKILASELMRFPKVFEQLTALIPPSEFSKTVLEFHRLWDAREQLGFFVMDPAGLKRLSQAAPKHEIEQTAYIPPRIWIYQVERLRYCLEDFLKNKGAIEECFNFCVDAYAKNYGTIEQAMSQKLRHRLPFWTPKIPGKGSKSGCQYHGPFSLTAERYGIANLLECWTGAPRSTLEVRDLSAYLSLVQYAGLSYIANFTLQRADEVASLRADCLIWEEDEKVGRVPIICGETTKTDPDSDARWPTSPSVEMAVDAMKTIARLRIRCAAADAVARPSAADIDNPYLLTASYEPWSGNRSTPYSLRTHIMPYQVTYTKRFDRLFDIERLRITEEDLRIARMLTPNLSEENGFAVGEVWPFTWHQLRRTTAVNMFASNLLSDSTLQFQMKHCSRLMPLYYGRGYTKLQLNVEVEKLIVESMYVGMAHNLKAAVGERFVSPLGQHRKDVILINLVSDKEIKQLANAGRRGQIHFRETRVGVCTYRGACSYGGIESVSRCTGGDGKSPCGDALYDRERINEIKGDLAAISQQLASAPDGNPRREALLAEREGMENYLNVIGS
ncbi:hypothetical protein [Janthinobacterium sp.]|uniref:hypothetical protein n=1 Tax=Janthinobacterium sp. TaxID=1871054 RepID=UPI0026176227|nr:hypothetical protein [Janthinobacterium sp.]